MDHITKHYAQLNYLTIFGSGTQSEEQPLTYKGESPKSNSVKILILTKFIFSQEQLFYVVSQLPSLEYLVLEDTFICGAAFGQFFFPVCLPFSQLACLEIYLNTDFSEGTEEKSYYCMLATDTNHHKLRYCFLTSKYNDNKIIGYNLLEDATESAFQASALNQSNDTYLIYCQSAKLFTVKYVDAENGYHKRIDLISNNDA